MLYAEMVPEDDLVVVLADLTIQVWRATGSSMDELVASGPERYVRAMIATAPTGLDLPPITDALMLRVWQEVCRRVVH